MPVAVEIKGSHSQAGTQARIISQYGCVCIQWDSAALTDILAHLKRERVQHTIGVTTAIGEAEHEALLAEAEQIKHRATHNNIRVNNE